MTTVSLTLSQVFQVALKAYQAGKLAEAERFCITILSADSHAVPALNLLAIIQGASGRFDEALASYDRALSLRPDVVEAWNNRGAVLRVMKRFDEALSSYDRALRLQPEHAEVLNNRAAVLHDLRRYGEALAGYDRALGLRPDYTEALNNRGITLRALGRHDEALASYDRLLVLRPDFVDALVNRGIALHALRRFGEALASYDRAIALCPDHADAFVFRANTLGQLRRHGEALAGYDKALGLCARHVEALVNRGATLHDLKRPEEALASYDRALEVEPDHPGALANRGVALHDLKRYGEALASHQRVLALWPDHATALSNRGITLHKLMRLDEALASYDHALLLQPDHVDALVNRGVTLHVLKRFGEASASYDRALAVCPDHADAHFFTGMSKLLAGELDRGWIEYEWRRKGTSASPSRRDYPQPPWLGDDEIVGRTVLLHSEQGFGDTIQFCRYAYHVAARGGRVVFEVEEPLRDLLTSLAGVTAVVAKGDPLPAFDLQCPLLSLPRAFGTRLETIPAAVPYLRVPAPARFRWASRLPAKRRPRIGLAWAGNAGHVRDRERSVALAQLSPLLEIDVTFVSLQREVRPADADLLAESARIIHFGDALAGFSDTAALISHLDLVISVDTAVAHLAGALGKPVWILLTHVPDWRWLLDRDDSPWYPTARLFRQDDTREWEGVIARVRDALSGFIAEQGPEPE